jgi:hypothetical protein
VLLFPLITLGSKKLGKHLEPKNYFDYLHERKHFDVSLVEVTKYEEEFKKELVSLYSENSKK